MSIEINRINKFFGRSQVLHDISLNICSGEMVALLGPSGSGKTTLLRIIAGLEQQSRGSLAFHGVDVSGLHPRDRQVGFVFQHYALFRHMSVFDNVAFGLTVLPRRQRPTAAAIKQKVTQLLDMVQLRHFANRYPAQLSGGQRQRVALARALAVEPQILLLDEPFGALDAQVRKELRRWLRQLHEELKFTSVFVTHDQEEALEVADRVVVMSQGNIEQVGTPSEIIDQPASRFVLEFIGEVNQFSGEVRGTQLFVGGYQWPLAQPLLYQGVVELFLRPWEMALSSDASPRCPLPVQVIEVNPHGHFWQLTVQPIGWHQAPLSVILPTTQPVPVRAGRYYVGACNARLYAGEQQLQPIALAKSA
ncbi:sulfate/thiosulfate ABC transporter ATP-binding protein CysA [Serratia microhaemolytica]|uniref:sulfate/thiosulfate ABC transporter ATP-binding protein CysA n=1 Tax=Serratia microhaemolytica TaxID=2675110 RepID=UPI000FDF22BC|nr:sulfate/thiosulfate ABC transporter ATP-binding protein CysA [Serratia microhaemolytica]